MRLPNGYGTVAKLSGKRRRPYIIKKTVGWKENGQPVVNIIGYAATREEGLALLAQFNQNPWDVDQAKLTLRQLFDLWQEKKGPKLGDRNRACLRSAFKHCSSLASRPYKSIKAFEMQDTIDNCGKGYSTQGAIKNLWGHLDRFALELDIVTRCYSDLLTAAPVPPTTRDRFSDEEIHRVWEHERDPWVDTMLILIYSGWRINEFLGMPKSAVDLQAGTMTGGSKTKAGKNRVVPIHSLIRPYIEARMARPGEYLISCEGKRCTDTAYRLIWKGLMKDLDMDHSPHECRHTFESLLDSAGANRKCIDLMMGHVSKDTGNKVYNHKTLEELRFNLELITKR